MKTKQTIEKKMKLEQKKYDKIWSNWWKKKENMMNRSTAITLSEQEGKIKILKWILKK